jgi:hypothetical protein
MSLPLRRTHNSSNRTDLDDCDHAEQIPATSRRIDQPRESRTRWRLSYRIATVIVSPFFRRKTSYSDNAALSTYTSTISGAALIYEESDVYGLFSSSPSASRPHHLQSSRLYPPA